MKTFNNPAREVWKTLCERPTLETEFLESTVRNILERVRNSGDTALKELTWQFDKVELANPEVTKKEIADAIQLVSDDLKDAIRVAAKNIARFHSVQIKGEEKVETMPGVTCWRKPVPLDSVGIYIPGGTAPLFSTVLMLGIPASLSGCKEIILCTPPGRSGDIHPAILYAASVAGITRIFKVGGAQAIGAMSYGTESIPRVGKILGPGNQYVTKAKQLVNQSGTAIDFPAGPSEVLIVADTTATPAFVAADLIAQAEHGEDSQVILVTNNSDMINLVQREVGAQLKTLPRREVAERALQNSKIILLERARDIIDFINEYAPEHLIINTRDPLQVLDSVRNAGSVFLGNYSAEAIGDYASGTNHTLPTNGYAKCFSGVSVESFMRYVTVQEISKEGLLNISSVVENMASAEMLEGHKRSVEIRKRSLSKK